MLNFKLFAVAWALTAMTSIVLAQSKCEEPVTILFSFACDKGNATDYYGALERDGGSWFSKNAAENVKTALLGPGANVSSVNVDRNRHKIHIDMNFDKDGKSFHVVSRYKLYLPDGTEMSSTTTDQLYYFSGSWDKYDNFFQGMTRSLTKYLDDFLALALDINWNKAKGINTMEAFDSFVKKNPDSKYSEAAREEMASIERMKGADSATNLALAFLDPATNSFQTSKSSVELGEKVPVAFMIYKEDQFISATPNVLYGRVPYADFRVNCTNCKFNNGMLEVDGILAGIMGNDILLEVTHIKSGTAKQLAIPIGFKGGLVFDFHGTSGKAGAKGSTGSKGKISNSSALVESLGGLASALAGSSGGGSGTSGGMGLAGAAGAPGGAGESGANANDIDILLGYSDEGGRGFIKGTIASGDQVRHFKVDILKGGIKILANGGSGGDGGEGGKGGDGADGQNGANGQRGSQGIGCNDGGRGGNGGKGGDGGDGADGANGGDAGQGGDGANVRLIIDPAAVQYQNLLTIVIDAGRAGRQGRGGVGGRPGREGQGGKGGYGGNKGYGGTNCRASNGQAGSPGQTGRGSNVYGRNGNDGNTAPDGRAGQIRAVKQSVTLDW